MEIGGNFLPFGSGAMKRKPVLRTEIVKDLGYDFRVWALGFLVWGSLTKWSEAGHIEAAIGVAVAAPAAELGTDLNG
ncbi:hypothetical protein F0562_034546 [Nyssa sinensis]|uniref:Uncharacterized protein n=1 Tax=Nyssa sinensis TaxID=561372 RepID=A0A5J5AG83_9ASTE|nr:hypothetical protein F0562_034546 [Nyssa sinensis]